MSDYGHAVEPLLECRIAPGRSGGYRLSIGIAASGMTVATHIVERATDGSPAAPTVADLAAALEGRLHTASIRIPLFCEISDRSTSRDAVARLTEEAHCLGIRITGDAMPDESVSGKTINRSPEVHGAVKSDSALVQDFGEGDLAINARAE